MIRKIHAKLLKNYGTQGWWPLKNVYSDGNKSKNLNDEEIFEISVGAILTQNAAWKNVEKSLNNLRNENLLSKEGIKNIESERLAELIKSSVYHNQKTKKLKLLVDFLNSGKEINRENLLDIWGVGPETADSILLYAYKKPIFVVDAYTKRIFSRLGLIDKKDSYDNVQKYFMNNLKEDVGLFNEYHALIVEHAKQKCKTKPDCDSCCLKELCNYGCEKS
tara:strand:- start:210 stop:869 length:660 start_codon:yes stop_codon:yes gene_type:complete